MPRGNRLFTLLLSLAVCLHTIKLHICMIWLTMVLQQPAIARRTFAIELLRRSDQIQSYKRRARSKTLPPPRLCVLDPTLACPRAKQTCIVSSSLGPKITVAEGCSRLRAKKTDVVSTGSALASSDDLNGIFAKSLPRDGNNGMSGTSTQRSTTSASSLRRTNGLIFTSSGSAVDPGHPQIQARDVRGQAAAPVGPGTDPTPPISPMGIAKRPYERSDNVHEHTPRPREERTTTEMKSTIDCLPTPPLSEHECLEITSTHDNRLAHVLVSSFDMSVHDDATEGAQEFCCDTPKHISIMSTEPIDGPFEHRAQKRWSAYSMDSMSTTIRKSPVILRSPSKSNGGLLEFKAKTTGPEYSAPRDKHQRLLSLNVPIRPSSSQPEADPLTSVQPSTLSAHTPWFGDEEADITVQINSELQYKQRHIFVGTASLHAFLDELETCTPDTTTKPAVFKAFTTLAHKEQLLARQCSLSCEDWTLVTRITTDMSEFDYITLARVQLGSISLQRFVDSIPFNILEEAPLTAVVEAFKIASHIDSIEAQNTSSKARAFRDLLMARNSAVD